MVESKSHMFCDFSTLKMPCVQDNVINFHKIEVLPTITTFVVNIFLYNVSYKPYSSEALF